MDPSSPFPVLDPPSKLKYNNVLGQVVEENTSVEEENNKYNYAHYVGKHKEMLRKTASMIISGFPILNHNFPSPLGLTAVTATIVSSLTS